MARYDTVVTGGTVVLPRRGPVACALGLRDGRIAAVAEDLKDSDGEEKVDARGLVVFPGGVDSHVHLGIYRGLVDDVTSESRMALTTGSTTLISYFRTGKNYLNRTAPYREIVPILIDSVKGHSHVDVGFHVAPMTSDQVKEVDWLAGDAGIASFKYYFFYKGLNLNADSTDAQSYIMSDNYDFGHLYSLMEAVAEADQRFGSRGRISLSLHCENPELIRLFIERVRELAIPVLEKYSRARPPLAERLAIHEAGVLASAARVRINLLHISSAEALLAANQVRSLYPELDIAVETTGAHLFLTYEQFADIAMFGKVNPPIRTRSDVDALWHGIQSGQIDWVCTDHGCCMRSMKSEDLWASSPSLGASPGLYPLLLTGGYHERGLPLERVAELASTAPARAFGCYPRKGAIEVGADADLTLIDIDKAQVVTPQLLNSYSDFSAFQGITLRGWPVRTILRGRTIFHNGEVIGSPSGEFLPRPLRSIDPAVAL
jgi:dihydropyrimidinase/allantoinase